MVYVLTGEITLFEGDVATLLTTGDAACFQAGDPTGHCFKNLSEMDASYLVIGTRTDTDIVTYPGRNRRLVRKNGIRTWTDESGAPAADLNDVQSD